MNLLSRRIMAVLLGPWRRNLKKKCGLSAEVRQSRHPH